MSKNIIITFFDDTETIFENIIYIYNKDFYSGELKNKSKCVTI